MNVKFLDIFVDNFVTDFCRFWRIHFRTNSNDKLTHLIMHLRMQFLIFNVTAFSPAKRAIELKTKTAATNNFLTI